MNLITYTPQDHPAFRGPLMVYRGDWVWPVYDLIRGHPKYADTHWVPKDRDYSRGLDTPPDALELVSAETLHREALAGRGRPPRFAPAEARDYRRRYWDGDTSVYKLAKDAGASTGTMWYLIHGYTYWYA